MKLLVLSFYYRPDLSAGSFRTTALVEALLAAAPPGSTIDVVTTLPNRYHSFTADAPELEHDGPLTVHRVPLPRHRSGMLDQSRAFLPFARAALRIARGKGHDLVYATSSRLMTASLGALIAHREKTRLYLDLRDIFVDTVKEVAPRSIAWLMEPVFSILERRTVGAAHSVNLVSRGFAGYFTSRYPRQRLTYFTNGVDDEFLHIADSAVPAAAPGAPVGRPLTVLYAGNLGEGQGLHSIVPALARRLRGTVRFRIIGDGGRRNELMAALADGGAADVELCAPMARPELIEAYESADVLFVHLNDYAAFRKVLPSKLFEYAATGKPIWAGVAGYAADFLRAEVSNCAVFTPCDPDDALRVFRDLSLSSTPRAAFLDRYSRKAICREMALDIIGVATRSTPRVPPSAAGVPSTLPPSDRTAS